MNETPVNVNVNVGQQPAYGQQSVYGQQPAYAPQQAYAPQPAYTPPPGQQLPTDRSAGKAILLSLITFGIYGLVLTSKMIKELNITASRDGKNTKGLLVMILLSLITFGIYAIIWNIGFIVRIGDEAQRRNTGVNFGITDWLIWSFLLSWTIVGPIIFMSKRFKAFNAINASYNQYG